jgi:hypothetical protein
MIEQPVSSQFVEPPNPQLIANERLKNIEDHLKSIRSMLNFFTVLVVLALIIQGCNWISAITSCIARE